MLVFTVDHIIVHDILVDLICLYNVYCALLSEGLGVWLCVGIGLESPGCLTSQVNFTAGGRCIRPPPRAPRPFPTATCTTGLPSLGRRENHQCLSPALCRWS